MKIHPHPFRGLVLIFGAAIVASAIDGNLTRLDRQKLLQYHDGNGNVAPARTKDDWLRRRSEIIRGAESVMGEFPRERKRGPLDVKIEEETDCGDHVRRLISYESEPGSRVPAYLLIPKSALAGKPAPGVLCLHGTDNKIGHAVVIEGLGGKPNRQYASELAKRGFVALAPNYPLLAKYQPDLKALGWHSGTMKAIWDNSRGLDLLDAMPGVKHGSYGVIGHSLGGHNSVFTAVFEDRIKVVVSSCGLDSFPDYYGGDSKRWAPGQGWCQDRYMGRMAEYQGHLADIPFDFHELIGALAPRPVFLSAPLRDANFKWDSVDRIVHAAREVYALYGVPENLMLEHPDTEHDFSPEMREKAYALLEKTLR